MLMDSIFYEENFLGTITWEKRTKAQNTETAKRMLQSKTEYILAYKKDPRRKEFNLEAYGVKIYDHKDKKGLFRYKKVEEMSSKGMRGRNTMVYPILNVKPRDEYQWKLGKETIKTYIDKKEIEIIENKPYLKIRPADEQSEKFLPFWSHFFDKEGYGTAEKGKKELTKILGNDDHNFETVKPVDLIKKLLFHINNREALILDFFAGSGTTGHAVLELNKDDGGNRQFILCTNNENKIAEDITYPRVKNVINGYSDIKGISANLKYFKTNFVKKSEVSDDTRKELVRKSTDMICVKESTYDKKYDNKDYKIYSNNERSTGILFNLDKIKDFKEKIEKVGLESSLYVFTLSNDVFDSDFDNLSIKYELTPIPESILEVYKKLFA
jgi:adenine-specific DNA-methyltransferase